MKSILCASWKRPSTYLLQGLVKGCYFSSRYWPKQNKEMIATRKSALALMAIAPAAAFLPAAPGGFAPQNKLPARHSANVHGNGLGASFAPSSAMSKSRINAPQRLGLLSVSASASDVADAEANKLPAYSKFGQVQIKGKAVSVPIGILFLMGSFLWAVALFPFVLLAYAYSKVFDNLRRRAVDFGVALWAKGAMISLCYWPKLVGAENLPASDEAVMYIPNHCSYLDIFTLSGTVPRCFKYMSKQEILAIPIIGWAMQMAGHIGIKRMDKRSQLEAFKAAVDALKKGNSVVTFAEGTRSPDGRLQPMKAGPIKMAVKAGVKVVPVSICNLYKWMPTSAGTPLAFPQQVQVKIHPAMDTKGKTEEELLAYVFDSVNSGLPDHQKTITGNTK